MRHGSDLTDVVCLEKDVGLRETDPENSEVVKKRNSCNLQVKQTWGRRIDVHVKEQ